MAWMSEALDAEWFLVANKDKLSIKIKGQVTLGEDHRGLLTLESRKDAERWFTLSVDHQDALVISELGAHWEVESPGAWVSQQPGVVCIPGTLLSLPNNEVYISHNLLRGTVQQHLVVRAADDQGSDHMDIVVTESLESVVDESDAKLELEVEAEKEAEKEEELLITALPPGSPAQVKEKTPEASAPEIPTLTAPIASPDIEAPQEEGKAEERKGKSSKAPYVSLALVGIVGVAGYFYWQAQTPVTQSNENAAVVTPAAPQNETENKENVPAMAQDGVVETSKELKPDPQAVSLPAPVVEPVSEIAEVQPQDWQQQLSEARFLMDRGFINYPERNAVSILGEILAQAPGQPEAWQLLNEATETYLTDALKAHADGFTDAAREMIAEVERFHPNYEQLEAVKAALSAN